MYFLDEDEYFESYEPTKTMPNVEYLRIVHDDRYDSKLMKMTPNVKTFVLHNRFDRHPKINFHDMSIYLPKLEYLEWETWTEMQQDLQSTNDLDALLTGFSKQFCKEKSIEFRAKDTLPDGMAAFYERCRLHTSLIDLKGVKRIKNFSLPHLIVLKIKFLLRFSIETFPYEPRRVQLRN